MMRDLLYEESATSSRGQTESKFYMFFFVASIVCFVVAAVVVFFATSFIQGILGDGELSTFEKIFNVGFIVIVAVAFLGSGVLFWFIRRRFNVSYDYTFVEDELRVTKVFNGRSRKYFATIAADAILKIGWCDKPSFTDVMRGVSGKPKYLTPNKSPAEEKEFVYLLVSGQLGKTLYVVECRRMLLEYLVQAAGVNKLEKE